MTDMLIKINVEPLTIQMKLDDGIEARNPLLKLGGSSHQRHIDVIEHFHTMQMKSSGDPDSRLKRNLDV